jgi:putative protease
VYLGGHRFSARRNAVNFSAEELRDAIAFCHGYGIFVYVTVNILARETELPELSEYIRELAEGGCDALIVQDLGTARLARLIAPDLPLHASTQMSVHTPEGVNFLAGQGFTRVVIARECTADELMKITKTSPIGVEAFVHGAHCVSVSGQCGLSAFIGGRSGNRGLCAQPCRLNFSSADGHHYALSLKDLSLIERAGELWEMGVCALKIEGRMKRPEYVAAAVTACREILAGKRPDMERLRAAFSRQGFSQGYYLGDHADMGGVRTVEDVRAGAEVLPELAGLYKTPVKRVPISIDLTLQAGFPAELTASDGISVVTACGEVPETAQTRELDAESVKNQIFRLGGTPFELAALTARIGPGLFLSAASLNALRRDVCNSLLAARVKRASPNYIVNQIPVLTVQGKSARTEEPFLRFHCQTVEQANAAAKWQGQIVLPLAEAEKVGSELLQKLLVEPPRYVREENGVARRLTALHSFGAQKLLCQNPAHAFLGRKLGYQLSGGLFLNVSNSLAVKTWEEFGLTDLTVSAELRFSEIRAIHSNIPLGIAAYGKVPVMLLRRCPFKKNCKSCPGELTDRTGRVFPLRCFGDYREMLNSDTLWIADLKLPGTAFLSILLNDETPEDMEKIGVSYERKIAPPAGHTRGLYKRGVE